MSRRGAIALAVVLAAASAAGAERIRSFDTSIVLVEDGSLHVEERIRWDFEGAKRHGIYREIPVAYVRPNAPSYHIGLHVLDVTDASGKTLPTEVSRSGYYLRIRIGDPKATVTGVHDYHIHYRVTRVMAFLDEHDELYWNATGTEWRVPIDRTEVEIAFPRPLDRDDVRLACYTGPPGSRRSNCAIEPGAERVHFRTRGPLLPHTGLTIVVGFPKGIFPAPSAARKTYDRARDYGLHWIAMPLLVLGGMLQLWRWRGRDPTVGHAIAVRYEPPEGLTPAEVGTLYDEDADVEDVTATILDLAVRGFLTIEEIESSKLLFFSDRDYRLVRRQASVEGLKRHETQLLVALFAGGGEVLVSSLRNKFYKKVPAIRRALYEELTAGSGLFAGDPSQVRRRYLIAGVVLGVLGLLVQGWFPGGSSAPVISFAVSGGLVALVGRFMPRRTRRGRALYEHVAGFREFAARVDADRLERLAARTASAFERTLPYAVVLGVADQWTQAFADIYTTPPSWYRGSSFDGGTFQPLRFVRHVGQSLDTMGKTLTSTPRGSGTSGFSGGSSGGGYGGGGGGSW